jgi:hypothetical protein
MCIEANSFDSGHCGADFVAGRAAAAQYPSVQEFTDLGPSPNELWLYNCTD